MASIQDSSKSLGHTYCGNGHRISLLLKGRFLNWCRIPSKSQRIALIIESHFQLWIWSLAKELDSFFLLPNQSNSNSKDKALQQSVPFLTLETQ